MICLEVWNVSKADLHPDSHVRLTERGSLAVVPVSGLLRAILHLKNQAEQTRGKIHATTVDVSSFFS